MLAGILSLAPPPSTAEARFTGFGGGSERRYGAATVNAWFRRWALCLLVWVPVAGCDSPPSDETPQEALSLFLDAMSRSDRDPQGLKDAYGLLAPSTREALQRRARRAGMLAGRDFEPWEMLAQGRFRLRFAPERASEMEVRHDGDRAVVVVEGAESEERAEVPMRREGEHWRVALAIPPMRTRPAALPERAARAREEDASASRAASP